MYIQYKALSNSSQVNNSASTLSPRTRHVFAIIQVDACAQVDISVHVHAIAQEFVWLHVHAVLHVDIAVQVPAVAQEFVLVQVDVDVHV